MATSVIPNTEYKLSKIVDLPLTAGTDVGIMQERSYAKKLNKTVYISTYASSKSNGIATLASFPGTSDISYQYLAVNAMDGTECFARAVSEAGNIIIQVYRMSDWQPPNATTFFITGTILVNR